jgi:hypothetical protein
MTTWAKFLSGRGAVLLIVTVAVLGGWTPWAYIKASNTALQMDPGWSVAPGTQAAFGASVATDGTRLVVSAPREDSCARGVDGDQHDHGCPAAGAVYVYEPLP